MNAYAVLTALTITTVLLLLTLLPFSSAQINNQLWFNNGQSNIGQFGAGGNAAFTSLSSLNWKSVNMEPMIPAPTIMNKPSMGITNWIIKLAKKTNCLNGDSTKENYPNWCFLNRDDPNGYFPSNGYSNSDYPDVGSGIREFFNIFIYFNIMFQNGNYPDKNYPNEDNGNGGHLNGQKPNIAIPNVLPYDENYPNEDYPDGTTNNGEHLKGQNLNTVSPNVVIQNGSDLNGVNRNGENLNKQNPNITSPNVVFHNGSNSNGNHSKDIYPIEISPNRDNPEISSLNNSNNGIGQNLLIDTYIPTEPLTSNPLGLNDNFTTGNMNMTKLSENGNKTETSFQSNPSDINDGISGINKTQDREQCRDDEFLCGSNECVPSNVKCDKKADCSDSSDETFCIMERDQENGCALPEQPTGGRYKLEGCDELCRKQPGDIVPQYSILTYTCNDNYTLDSSNTTICDKTWEHQVSCLKICPPLNSTSVDISCNYRGKEVYCSEPILPGTQATLACKQFYTLPSRINPGYRMMECLDDGSWNRTIFYCMPECGKLISQDQKLTVNGVETKVGLFPWHVVIYEKDNADTYKQICGGTIITSKFVISAAHCFYDDNEDKPYNVSKYAVGAGKQHRAWDADEQYSQKSLVKDIMYRNRYSGKRTLLAEDIAVVKLVTSFVLNMLVWPICIDWRNMYEAKQLQVGQSGKIVSLGRDITGKPIENLYEAAMPYVQYQKCRDNVPVEFRRYITLDKFCAGYINGSNICDGDSGNGLCFEKDGIWYLRGIVSVAPQGENGQCNSYVAFTYISHYRSWLLSKMSKRLGTGIV
ncbi:modular serine protease isoform X2 [Harpegnathos saltator]|uniref:modular serine protease isoform X2 n=1 Tax=Harpegnathos saltator TaxID=610380 RepID=UPI000DBEEA94|nr:modular serine protease isoform X2 [Harpegnathos saltator]